MLDFTNVALRTLMCLAFLIWVVRPMLMSMVLTFYQLSAADVLAHFDAHARLLPVPAKAPVTCSDADDQMFIDLAVAQRSTLLSKDKAVTSMQKRLLALGVRVQKTL